MKSKAKNTKEEMVPNKHLVEGLEPKTTTGSVRPQVEGGPPGDHIKLNNGNTQVNKLTKGQDNIDRHI